jgi:hypothetical protein
MDQARRLPLWQRNLIGLALTAAALTALVAVDLWPPWTSYRDTVQPEYVVAPRQSLTVDGQTWAVADIRHLRPQAKPGAPPLPDGTVVTEVRLEGAKPPDTYLTGVLTDGQRRWRGDTYGAQPGELQWSFVVPADAVPTALDVTRLDGSILVRLQL